eukprot:4951660-Pyramimonas_sp.AAC.3
MAPQAMLWLQERAFDVVHFADWQGHGYYTLLAKHSGVGFTGTTLCLMGLKVKGRLNQPKSVAQASHECRPPAVVHDV